MEIDIPEQVLHLEKRVNYLEDQIKNMQFQSEILEKIEKMEDNYFQQIDSVNYTLMNKFVSANDKIEKVATQVAHDQDKVYLNVQDIERKITECVNKTDIAEIYQKLNGFANFQDFEKLRRETDEKLKNWVANLDFYRLENSQFRNEHQEIKECVRAMDENLCTKANKAGIYELQQYVESNFLYKQVYEDDTKSAKERAAKYETNSKLVLDQLSEAEKRLEYDFKQQIKNTLNNKFTKYDDVCKNFQGFFNAENLHQLLSEKIDRKELHSLNQSYASNKQIEDLKKTIDTQYQQIKTLSVMQTELARSLVPIKASSSFKAAENVNTKLQRRESLVKQSELTQHWIIQTTPYPTNILKKIMQSPNKNGKLKPRSTSRIQTQNDYTSQSSIHQGQIHIFNSFDENEYNSRKADTMENIPFSEQFEKVAGENLFKSSSNQEKMSDLEKMMKMQQILDNQLSKDYTAQSTDGLPVFGKTQSQLTYHMKRNTSNGDVYQTGHFVKPSRDQSPISSQINMTSMTPETDLSRRPYTSTAVRIRPANSRLRQTSFTMSKQRKSVQVKKDGQEAQVVATGKGIPMARWKNMYKTPEDREHSYKLFPEGNDTLCQTMTKDKLQNIDLDRVSKVQEITQPTEKNMQPANKIIVKHSPTVNSDAASTKSKGKNNNSPVIMQQVKQILTLENNYESDVGSNCNRRVVVLKKQ